MLVFVSNQQSIFLTPESAEGAESVARMHLKRVRVPDFRVLKDVDLTFEPDLVPRIFPLGSLNTTYAVDCEKKARLP